MPSRDSRINIDPEYYPEFRALKLRYEANTRDVCTWTDFLKFLVGRALPHGVVDEGVPDEGVSGSKDSDS